MTITLNLMHGEWYTSQTSGMKMALFLYDKDITSTNKQKLHSEILSASKSTIFHVRKAVAHSLLILLDKFPLEDVYDMVRLLVKDNTDKVQIECILNILKYCSNSNGNDEVKLRLLRLTIGLDMDMDINVNDDEGEDMVERTVKSELILLYGNEIMPIRRAVATHAYNICKILDKDNL